MREFRDYYIMLIDRIYDYFKIVEDLKEKYKDKIRIEVGRKWIIWLAFRRK